MFAESRLHNLIMSFIMSRPMDEQYDLVSLLFILTNGMSPVLKVQAPASGTPRSQVAFASEFWRLWNIFVGPAPFLRVWDGNLITDGSFLQDVEDTGIPQGLDSDLRTDILREFEAWYASFEFYQGIVQGDLDKATVSDMFYEDLALNVAEW
jgi:hypothetical protein